MSPSDSNLTPEVQELLARRYGKRFGSRGLKGWKLTALVVSAFFIPWLLWSAWHHSNPEIRTALISFQNATDNSIDITYLVERRSPATSLLCTLIARDIDKNVVGEIQEKVPPAKQRAVTITTTIPTRFTPVNAAVLECSAAQD